MQVVYETFLVGQSFSVFSEICIMRLNIQLQVEAPITRMVCLALLALVSPKSCSNRLVCSSVAQPAFPAAYMVCKIICPKRRAAAPPARAPQIVPPTLTAAGRV